MNRSTATTKLQAEADARTKAAQKEMNATPMGVLLLRYKFVPWDTESAARKVAEMAAKDIGKLLALLSAANAHLEYCNFGDKWERECAEDAALPARLNNALEEWTQFPQQDDDL